MAFDQRAYLRDVVMPLRDRPGGPPATDLARQYAVTPDLAAAQLCERLAKVRRLWNQRSGGIDASAAVCAQLLSRDEQLRAEHGDAMSDPAWWQARMAEHEREVRAESERFAEDLARAYGALGRITRVQLDEIAEHWPGLSQHEVDEALRRAGLAVVESVQLPVSSGLERSAYRALARLQGQLGASTAVQVVHPGAAPFRLLGRDAVALDAGTVADQVQQANRAADSAAVRVRKEALGLLERACADGVDLRAVALFQIVDRLRAGRARHLVDGLLVRIATDAGLELGDAQTVVANLAPLPGPEAAPADKIRDLVADGRLRAAEQALAVLPATDPGRTELGEQIAALVDEVGRLRRAAEAAARAEREDEAASLLRTALRIAADDEELVDRLHGLPPPPPADLTVRARDAQVRLSWTAPPGVTVEPQYRIVRGDRPPRSPGDGDVVAERPGAEAVDEHPPPGRQLHYAVFASVGGAWSRAAHGSVRVLPPVTAVQVWVRANEISCAWRTHPAAEGVRVRRTLGRPPASPDDGELVRASHTGLSEDTASADSDRFYGIVATYRDEHGGEVGSAMLVARAAVCDEAPATVQKLRAHATALDAHTASVEVAWQTPAAGAVSIRRSGQRPGWPAGAAVSREELDSYGAPLVGDRVDRGAETWLEATVPVGQFFLTPFTVDAAGAAVVGESVFLAVTEPVQRLVARRTGGEVTVGWVWPPSVNVVEVTFTPAHGAPSARRVTRGQFADSGCRVPVGLAGGRISVRAVSRGHGSEALSAPASVPVDGVAATVAYHLARPAGPVNRLTRRRMLQVRVDQPCDGVELRLVAASGLAMPVRPEQGSALVHVSGLSLRPGVPWEAPFTLPAGLAKPYWLRCFVVRPPEVRVTDPIDQMRVP